MSNSPTRSWPCYRASTGVRSFALALLVTSLVGCPGEQAECGDCFERGFRVTPTNADEAAPPPAILFSGFRNGWCQEDLICTGAPDVFLGDIRGGPLDMPSLCKKKEAVAFAGGHGPTAFTVNTSQEGQPVSLNATAEVPLTVWIVKGIIQAEGVASDIRIAAGRYADLGAGITFPDPRINAFPREVPDLYENASCLVAPLLLDQAGFDPGRVNIYYIKSFDLIVGGAGGLACADLTGVLPPIIFVDGEVGTSPSVLAHEIGHALGLRRSISLPADGYSSWGHTNEVYLDPYLAGLNLMRSGGHFVQQITLGQIYRMHFDQLSWLWYKKARETEYPRECQESPVQGGDCPALTRQPPRGWP